MSRLIVKNLPNGIKEDRLKTLFSSQGNITDCSLKYTKDGVFRKFAFIGFQNAEEAKHAQKYFDRSFIDTSRIQVGFAKSFGDTEKPRAWSKYAKDSSAYQAKQKTQKEAEKAEETEIPSKDERKKKAKEERLTEMLGDLKDDPGFEEFLSIHQNLGVKSTWGNDTIATQQDKVATTALGRKAAFDDDSGNSSAESESESEMKTLSVSPDFKTKKSTVKADKLADRTGLSDLDYLKSKMSAAELEESSSSDEEEEISTKEKNSSKSRSKKTEELSSSSSSSDEEEEIYTKQKCYIKSSSKKTEESSSSSSSDEEEEISLKKNSSKLKPKKPEESSSTSSSSDEEFLPPKGKKSPKPNSDKTKISKSMSSSSSSSSDEEEIYSKGKNTENRKQVKAQSSADGRESNARFEGPSSKVKPNKEIDDKEAQKILLKMRGFPGNVGENAIMEFFKPLKITHLQVPKNAKRRPIGVAFIEFETEKDLDQALRKNKNFLGGKRVFLNKITAEVEEKRAPKPRPWEMKKADEGVEEEGIGESGRLYVRNLAYVCTEEQLEELFSKYGPLTEVHLPVDKITKKIKGFAHITFMIPEHAVKAYTELDGSVFLGRMMHILPGKSKQEEHEGSATENSSFKKQKAAKQKATAGSSHNWNTLFLGVNAVADVMADKYGTSKSKILDTDTSQSLGVRLALGETQVVSETRDFLTENGVQLDVFSQPAAPRSKTVILVKNLPMGTKAEELRDVFSKYGGVGRVVLPPSGITAVIEFLQPAEARTAFRKLAYTKFKYVPLYLEWAPIEALKPVQLPNDQSSEESKDVEVSKNEVDENKGGDNNDSSSDDETESPEGTVLFVKNLNFDTREDALRKLFEKCGRLKSVTVAKKKDMKNPGQFLSMGYGFVEYKTKAAAQQALKDLQYAELDGHQVSLKVSNRASRQTEKSGKKKQKDVKQKSSKILVRNIPFEAKSKEILELFKVFGELKSVRLPKKLGGTGSHRGFGFIDFLTKQDAKRAFNALCHSTHLYGRRLVLEWAEAEENIEDLRKKTAQHFHDESPRKKLKKSDLLTALGE